MEEGGGDAEGAASEDLILAALQIAAFCLLMFVCCMKFFCLNCLSVMFWLNKTVETMYPLGVI